ncbi:hypothetical protein M878_28055 [Streptomyces roseochromogenus subsp. oscitans DS 12.976]|uniref:Uncharacterized protein n=2 Tax=Streptomyces roseochromogenus TaxID=285450 RepID=V6K319_STRRC|nr:hypothetical protein [Streptomyces roseochromogenus]EST25791.1 hypothetical protein M878_28055 [Streptomyces roseochromogenus subsp. oscitans DS 12.976]
MRTFVAGQEAYGDLEFAELALGVDLDPFDAPLGIDVELFRGPLRPVTFPGADARSDAARDILADLREQAAAGDEIAALDAAYAEALTHTVSFPRVARGYRPGTGEAA